MRVYKDAKTGLYHADYMVNGKRLRPSLHTKNKEFAQCKLAELRKIKNMGKGEVSPGLSFHDFAQYFLKHIHRATRTMQIFEHSIKMLEQFLPPNAKLIDITPFKLIEFSRKLVQEKRGCNAGNNRKLTAIKSMMRWAEKNIGLPPQNWDEVTKFKEKKNRIEFHSVEEINQLLQIMPTPDYKLVVLLGCRAGLRRGEMVELKWQDVDLLNNQLYIAPNKTENDRYVPIALDLKEALSQAFLTRKNSYVINVHKTMDRHSMYNITAMYAKITKKLPFNCFLHKLRHTFASHLVQNGVDLYTVSKLMGHTSVEMTEVYAHLAPNALNLAIKKLPLLCESGSIIDVK